MITLYGIPNCDTVKRARRWLADNGTACAFHDFKRAGVPPASLQRWIAAVGWEKLLNRQGTTWRRLDESLRAGVQSADTATKLMTAEPSVVKRPVVEWTGGAVTVGFDPADWQRHISAEP
jgi:arsenate reductase (glutaredoxin)